LKKSSTKLKYTSYFVNKLFTVSRELISPVTLESNNDAVFTKLSKMNRIQYNTAHSVQSQSVTCHYSVGPPNTLDLTAGLCSLNTSISFVTTA